MDGMRGEPLPHDAHPLIVRISTFAHIFPSSITVNGERVCASRAIADGDRVTHRVHRHEPPVTAQPVRIVGRTDRWIAVEKPSSVPMHPSGAYRYNTIVAIVERELGYGKVYRRTRLYGV